MNIDKNTILCCSFSKEAGSFGCKFHNEHYQRLGLNYVYKSFSVERIDLAMQAMRTLNIRGAGVSMPFKMEALKYVDIVSKEATEIGAANTVVNDNGVLTAYNTDWVAAASVLSRYTGDLVILGRGGYAKAVAYAREPVKFITRDNWDLGMRDSIVFNCTPVKVQVHESNVYIDSSVDSESGRELAMLQAKEQFRMYTGVAV